MDMCNLRLSSDTSSSKPGTCNKPVIPVQESVDGGVQRYEAITCQHRFRAFSFEEHRFEDYKQIKTDTFADESTQSCTIPYVGPSKKSPSNDKQKLNLLRGRGIEICVGMSNLSNGRTQIDAENIWSLPTNLISHYSPFLKTACSWNIQECHEERINLPEDDPTVFSLFVEWMYYGSYDTPSPTAGSNIDARCCVLGDKLLCNEFTNYAMRRLYEKHAATAFGQSVTCDDVQYACDNAPLGSRLRQFYVDFVIEHFANPGKLHGTIGDWDAFLQRHSDIRVLLLEKFRQNFPRRTYIRDVDDYLQLTQPDSKQALRLGKGKTRVASREIIDGNHVEQGEIDGAFRLEDMSCAESEFVTEPARSGQEEFGVAVAPEEIPDKPRTKGKRSKLKNRKKVKPIEPSTAEASGLGQGFPSALESKLAREPIAEQETQEVGGESAGVEEIT